MTSSLANGVWCFRTLIWVTFLVAVPSRDVNAGLFEIGGVTWKEGILLHDGSKIVVTRSQSYGGLHELGKPSPIKEQELAFSIPGSDRKVTFKSEYSDDVGRANFMLLALHILNGTPYIIAEPNLCLAYNKWGRPNPPYVMFRYDGSKWKQIALKDLPVEFRDINLVVDTKSDEKVITAQSLVSVELRKKLNSSLMQREYKTILREPIKPGTTASAVNCIKTNYYPKYGWLSPDSFTSLPSLDACQGFCNNKNIVPEACPCNEIFNEKGK